MLLRALFATGLVGLAGLSAGEVQAQAWTGPYVGATIGLQEAQDGDFKIVIHSIRDPRLTYTQAPVARTRNGPAFGSSEFAAIHAGWRVNVGPIVAGLEAQVQQGSAETRYVSGLVLSEGSFRACGTTALGCLYTVNDLVTAEASVDQILSLKASVGKPVSDRLLVSAYAGPSVAFGNVALSQETPFSIGVPRTTCTGTGCSLPIITDSGSLTRNRSGDDTAFGVTAGIIADFKLTESVMARADLSYARYEALRLDRESFETRVWAQPVLITASLGLSVRF